MANKKSIKNKHNNFKSKRKKPRGCFLVVLIVCALLLIFSPNLQRSIGKIFYPLDYWEEVTVFSKEYDVDPYLVMAVIKTESNFDEKAISSANACGLMQLMPDTAVWIVEKAQMNIDPKEAIWEPGDNIRMGIWYLRWLSQEYYLGNWLAALTAYNGGMQNVDTWLKDGTWDGSFEDREQIPFKETVAYLERVKRAYIRYYELYAPQEKVEYELK